MAKDWWETEDLGGKIGKVKVSDGPVGLRCLAITDSWENDSIYPSVAYPCYQMLSQTWDTQLAQEMGRAIADEPHEGPNVFYWQNKWWYIGDYWKGQKCFSSDDCTNWEYAGMILDKPGKRPHDQAIGNHADVLVLGEEAYIFYFSHVPVPEELDKTKPLPQEYRTLAVQVARLHTDGRMLYCDRDEEFDFVLPEL